MPPDPDDYLDDEPEEGSARSIFAAGWFRAVLFLVALAIALVISLPYLLEQLEPSRPAPQVSDQGKLEGQPPPPPPVAVPPPPVPAPPGAVATPTSPPAGAAPATVPAPTKAPGKAALEPAAGTAKPARRAEVRVSQKTARAEPRGERRVSSLPPADQPRLASRPAPSGEFWVQVGAFQDRDNADRLAKALQDKQYPAEVVQVTRPAAGGARHELFVTGASTDAVEKALGGSSTAEAVRGGVVVRPTLNLRDAVTLSRRLAAEGLVVKIRRVGEEDDGADRTYHLVRVGRFPDRAPAEAARRELEAAGHAGFVTQGPPK